MRFRRSLALATLLLWASGCLYHVREHTDDVLNELVVRPYDLAPAGQTEPVATPAPTDQPSPGTRPGETPLPQPKKTGRDANLLGLPQVDVQTTAFLQAEPPPLSQAEQRLREIQKRMDRLKIPEAIPGSETPLLEVPKEPRQKEASIQRIYPELPPLPIEPKALPGPNGQPYTLAALQTLAAANSPRCDRPSPTSRPPEET